MVGLVDLAPITACDSVKVSGGSVDIHPISSGGIAYLLKTYPGVAGLMKGEKVDASTFGFDAAATIIALGCMPFCRDPAMGTKPWIEILRRHEAGAFTLSLHDQADILAAIIKLTMPGGLGPLAEKMRVAGVALNPEAAEEKAPDLISPRLLPTSSDGMSETANPSSQ